MKLATLKRFEEETALSLLKGIGNEPLKADEIQEEAGFLIQNRTEDEILRTIGRTLPNDAIVILLRIHDFSRGQLPLDERKLLPAPEELIKKDQLGRTIFASVKRVLWRSLCDPKSDVYKAWFHSYSLVLDRKYIGSAVSAALLGMSIGIKALAVSFTALIIKMGLEVFCDVYKPEGIMIDKSEPR